MHDGIKTLFSILLGASLIAAAGCSASSGSTQQATVFLNNREVLRPGVTELPLMAGRVEECTEPDRSVTDVHVEETASEVVVSASLKVDPARDVGVACEIRTLSVPFTIQLKKPLGTRSVVGELRGVRQVISTTSTRRDIATAAKVGTKEARHFLAASYPPDTVIRCFRFGVERFECTTFERESSKRELRVIYVRGGRHLELQPATP